MPKKLDIPQENELTPEEIHEIPPPQAKPKRQISDAQREHLNNIRAKALQKKAEMKEETLKAKLAKTIEKKELVKKYDEYEQQKEKEVVKPKKEKKIVYKLAESSSSSSDEEEEVVYVKKIKDKKKVHHKKEDEDSLDSTLYKSSQELLHKRAIEERVRANLIKWNRAMMPQEY